MKNIYILNGANLNLLGKREPEIYGTRSFETFFEQLERGFPQFKLHYFQSNHEGELLDKLHAVGFTADGIVFNAGAHTHSSLALGDAIAGITSPVIEVHISNVYAREVIRHHSFLAKHCLGTITGFGLESYRLALQYFTY